VSFLPEIPRNGSGKILKRLLREPFWKGHQTGVL
jgi:acyl-coenzyme A synthetase/AMP-(fatty) acid ligase